MLIIHSQLYDIKCSYPIQIIKNRSIWFIDGTLTGTLISGQSGTGSSGNKEGLHTSSML